MSDQTKKFLGIHGGLVLAEVLCASAFIFELRRAIGGNQLSWAYVFEWPVFMIYGIYVWRKLLGELRDPTIFNSPDIPLDQVIEDSRASYNDYLTRVHQSKAPYDHSND